MVYEWATVSAGARPNAGRSEPPGHIRRAVGSPSVHNGWWFHNPVTEARYLFIGQEGPSVVASSSGDIHVWTSPTSAILPRWRSFT